MAKNYTAFIGDVLAFDTQLASWLYLLGVTPEEFETVFLRKEHAEIYRQVPAYHRYAMKLREILLRLTDDAVQAFIKVPKNPNDNLFYGCLFRPADKKYLNVSYEGVAGLQVSDGRFLLLGGIPPVNIHPELFGNYSFIDKQQRDILFDLARSDRTVDLSNMEQVLPGDLNETRLAFLSEICIKYLKTKWPKHDIYDRLRGFGWTEEEAKDCVYKL